MKYKYMLFGYWSIYPTGGMNDCVLMTDDSAEVGAYMDDNEHGYDNFDVYCTDSNSVTEFVVDDGVLVKKQKRVMDE